MTINPKEIDEVLDEAQMAVDDRQEQELPEAPASVTLRVWIKGYGVMLTARDNKVSNLLKKTQTMIDYAESHGWKNTWEKEGAQSKPVVKDVTETADAPLCSAHKVPMTWREGTSKSTGKHYAFWACTEKNTDGSFCKAGAIKEQP